MSIKVYGASDDLIEVEGDISEEFNPVGDDDDPTLLAFSDGTVLSIGFGREGVWRIQHIARGQARVEIAPCPPDQDDDYSDVALLIPATLTPFKWVVHGIRIEKASA